MFRLAYILLCSLSIYSCFAQNETKSLDTTKESPSISPIVAPSQDSTLALRIAVPKDYQRTDEASHSFAHYLRHLPLKPAGSLVTYYNGQTKADNGVYCAVVDMPIGDKNLHQCADAIMRLRAEYLWNLAAYDKIHFNFTNGFKVDYTEWMAGKRIIVDGNKTYWQSKHAPSNTYDDFWSYMEEIFMYAGTASLSKELKSVPIDAAEIGDILIKGGFPGHAVVIVDKAIHKETGKPIYLLAQSYMPAQETQILNNRYQLSLSPWYELSEGNIYTPEWTFKSSQLKRFRE